MSQFTSALCSCGNHSLPRSIFVWIIAMVPGTTEDICVLRGKPTSLISFPSQSVRSSSRILFGRDNSWHWYKSVNLSNALFQCKIRSSSRVLHACIYTVPTYIRILMCLSLMRGQKERDFWKLKPRLTCRWGGCYGTGVMPTK